MTDDTIALRALLEKGSDATLLREMIGFAARRLMELETDTLCGAGHGERSESRTNQRNGFRDRNNHQYYRTVPAQSRFFRVRIREVG
jgi:putative transposase